MMRRDVGEAKDDIAAFAASDEKILFQQRDRVAAADRNQFTVHSRASLVT
jgi:hypothetical protein